MPIPKEILAVERPSSTVVKRKGQRWVVIKRTSKRVNGKVRSVDLGIIGEIINYKYHEIRKLGKREEFLLQQKKNEEVKERDDFIDEKDYGQIALCFNESQTLLQELEEHFGTYKARVIYTIAVIRVAYNDARDRDIDFLYRTSHLSNIFPGLHLSEDTVSKFLLEFGQRVNDMDAYMVSRVKQSKQSAIAIDGMLKDSNAGSNSFCEFSRKARLRGVKDYNQVYLYNLDTMEPIASYPYPGNMLDLTAFKDVLRRTNLENDDITWKEIVDEDGVPHKIPSHILLGDKGFYSQDIIKELDKRHIPYILPLKRDSEYVTDYEMNAEMTKFLKGYRQGHVYYKKVKTSDEYYLYSFRDIDLASKEEKDYIGRKERQNEEYEEELLTKRKDFGTITFISAVDLDPVVAYLAYQGRWTIEGLFQLYKCTLDLDTLNVQRNYRLYASEFINFISAIISSRIWNKMKLTILRTKRIQVDAPQENENASNKATGNTKKTKKEHIYVKDAYSFKELFLHLSKLKTRRIGFTDDWKPALTINKIKHICQVLNISFE